MTSNTFTTGETIFILFALCLYLLPSVIAAARKHHQATAIFILNLFLGWTFLGWVCSLVWSATATTTSPVTAAPAPHAIDATYRDVR
jgi:hypothetical protein